MAESRASWGLQPAYPNTKKAQRIHTLWSRRLYGTPIEPLGFIRITEDWKLCGPTFGPLDFQEENGGGNHVLRHIFRA